jgi:hypothetical protein
VEAQRRIRQWLEGLEAITAFGNVPKLVDVDIRAACEAFAVSDREDWPQEAIQMVLDRILKAVFGD